MTALSTLDQVLSVTKANELVLPATGPLLLLADPTEKMPDEVAAWLEFDGAIEPVVRADAKNPLLLASTIEVTGIKGFIGSFELGGAGVYGNWGDEVLAMVDGRVVAARKKIGDCDVVLVAARSVPSSFEAKVAEWLGARLPAPASPARDVLVIESPAFTLNEDPGTELGSEGFLAAVRRAGRKLPAEIYDAVKNFADNPPASGGMLLKGLPIGELPDTPTSPRERAVKSLDTELLLCAVARLLGQPVGYAPELSGQLVQDLVPVQADRYKQVSTSSGSTLDWHTEAAFHPYKPRYLLLLCLRGNPEARTTLASIRLLLPYLEPAVVDTLRRPLFTTRADESYVGGRPTKKSLPQAIITGPRGAEQLCFDADLMEGVNEEARAALEALLLAVRAHQDSVCLESGDLLIVDNNLAVHGRSPFTPKYDGKDRWLQRTFVVSDLSLSATDRMGRVIDTRFLA